MLAFENHKMATILKVALRTRGVDVTCGIPGVGESIKETVDGLYSIKGLNSSNPNELVLFDRITTKLVYNPDSPLALISEGETYYIKSKSSKEPLTKVRFSKRPTHYAFTTRKGTPMKNVAQVMGADCLAIAVDKQCYYFKHGNFCKYCNITPTNIKSGISRLSSYEDLQEVVASAGRSYRFIDLTGGTFEDRDDECREYTKIGNIIKEGLGRASFSGPFSLSPPNDPSLLEDLHSTGVDVISFNPDIWDLEAWRNICPGKFEIGRAHYDVMLQHALNLWGSSNVAVQFLAGSWESNASLLEGVRHHLYNGILVNITSFQGSPGSAYRNAAPKSLRETLDLYITYGELVRASGLYPNKRRSVLTSESANRSSISNEVAKGYLTQENFEPYHDLELMEGIF